VKVALPLPEPTVMEPLRCGPVLAFTVKPALPLPVPVWPYVMVIQLLLLLTGRLQLPGAAVIEKLESLAAAGAEYEVGFRLTVHCAHAGDAAANRKESHRRPL
jgi:hypothetical protein